MKTIQNRNYGIIPLGLAVRGSIAQTYIYRVRRGNGNYSSILGVEYQDRYAYFVPVSINNTESEPYRRQLTAAVSKWRFDLSPAEKKEYNTLANKGLRMSGYNLFMRRAMKGEISMFVDRGDPAAFDFDLNDFTKDGTWYDLDISGLITISARAVLIEFEFETVMAEKEIKLRKYGNSNTVNHWDVETFVGNKHQSAMAIVAVDENRIVSYNIDTANWTSLDAVIRGWWT